MATQATTTIPRSDAAIDKLTVPDLKPVELGDGSGLRLRLNPAGASGKGGSRVWRWFVLLDGKRLNVTLGTWARDGKTGLTLSGARQRLDFLKAAHAAGTLRVELDKAAPRTAARDQEGEVLVRDLVADFRTFIGKRRKNPGEVERTLDNEILPAIGDRPLRSVTTRDVRRLVEAVVARGATSGAGKVLAHARQLFRFAQGRDDLQSNPAEPLDPETLGVVARACDRFLAPQEIAAFWKSLDKSGATPSVRAALRLLLLLGVRSGELLRATWEEIDVDSATWTIPIAHQKLTRKQAETARPWVVPLSQMAVELLKELEVFSKSLRSTFVVASFAAENGGALSEKALIHAMRRLFEGDKPLLVFPGERPTPHDLRRTLRTHLGTLGVDFHVAERCLNHSLGGMAATYDRGDYLQQRRDALEKWAAYLGRVISGEKKVAFLTAKSRS